MTTKTFNEKLDEILTTLVRQTTLADRAADIAKTADGVKDASKRFVYSMSEAKQSLSKLIYQIIGYPDELRGRDDMLEPVYHRNKGRNQLRERQHKLAKSMGFEEQL